jgi:hypothetical protein
MRRAIAILILAAPLLAFPTGASAISSQTPQTFSQLISGMKLVILAKVSGSETQGYTYTVEQVLQGSAGPALTFDPDAQAAVQPGWTEAVVAFSNLTTDDFRAPTVAWHVAPDGTIDPEKFAPYPGLPATLADMLAFFGASASPSAVASVAASAAPPASVSIAPSLAASLAPSTAPPATPVPTTGTSSSGPSWSVVLLLLLALLAALVLLAVAIRRQRRP